MAKIDGFTRYIIKRMHVVVKKKIYFMQTTVTASTVIIIYLRHCSVVKYVSRSKVSRTVNASAVYCCCCIRRVSRNRSVEVSFMNYDVGVAGLSKQSVQSVFKQKEMSYLRFH